MADVVTLAREELAQLRPLLLDLLVEDQGRYGHRQMTREEIDLGLLGPIEPRFQGENLFLAVKHSGQVAALCWCVIFDPGTGLEGEVAEVYVRPEFRGQGLAGALLRRAVELFDARGVTFAAVWTHARNPAAVDLYQEAGFQPTEQLVLTRLPSTN